MGNPYGYEVGQEIEGLGTYSGGGYFRDAVRNQRVLRTALSKSLSVPSSGGYKNPWQLYQERKAALEETPSTLNRRRRRRQRSTLNPIY